VCCEKQNRTDQNPQSRSLREPKAVLRNIGTKLVASPSHVVLPIADTVSQDMHYAEFAEDEVGPSNIMLGNLCGCH
jgi:hypothetical protein